MSDLGKNLVDSLVRDLRPVRPVRLGAVLALLLAMEVVFLVAGTGWAGIRHDIAGRLRDAHFIAVAALLVAVAVGSAWGALKLSVPGRELSGAAFAALLVLPPIAATAAVLLLPLGGRWAGFGSTMADCWRCIALTGGVAVVPWLFLVVAVSRLAPLRTTRVGLLSGLSALALGGLVTELHCAARDGYHLALGHYLPVLAMALVTGVVIARVLKARAPERARQGVDQ